ncbi:MAG: hypothetical protein COA45_11515 [Zetaproteobacteria bacterium]|nr:MAG: hypothetical protein COA45_11515 [Zetaproteobacteria bacterium]
MDRKLFDTLFSKLLIVWPVSINTIFKYVSDSGGARIPELIRIHDELEEKFDNLIEIYGEDMNQVEWALVTVIHNVAKENSKVVLDKIVADEVYEVVLDNLNFTEEDTDF